ncbi:MAG TPA: hypothetical protein DDX51_06585 [Clostridiales bacterium]|nr:hypothetical protein [Clostridiales bacterium]
MKKLFALTILFVALAAGIVRYAGGTLPLPDVRKLPQLLKQAEDMLPEPEAQPKAARRSSQMEQTDTGKALQAAAETRALWVATAYAIDYPAEPTADADTLRARCDDMLDAAQAAGINTIYFQVRPAADALYPSKRFPWSRYLTGTCGQAPEGGFDPLACWTEQAHARGMKLEAWINPYRICAGEHAKSDFSSLPDSSPAKQHPDWVVRCDGGYYFNPGLPEVRQLICDGVEEIVKAYDVDGIQFDDYFYPSPSFDDADTYAAHGGGESRDDWRRENVNRLVQAVGETVHRSAKNPVCVFGISPSGIWRNKGVNVFGGSDTHGYEHYTSSYADSLKWIKNGWIDYICPQIYWEIGDEAADFDTLARWWARQVQGTQVRLVLGLAAYKIGSTEYTDVWRTDGCAEIARQLDLAHSIDGIDGCAVFSARNLTATDGLSDVLRQAWTQ